jgi:proteasome lid subunit RPN8/RPN11
MGQLLIGESSVAQIRRAAEAAYPQECCGLMLGQAVGDIVHVIEVAPMTNVAAEPERRYEAAPRELLAAHMRAREACLDVVGAYHSHPNCAPKPSSTDLELACPGLRYLIVEVTGGTAADAMCWTLRDDRAGFVQEPITLPS